MGSKLFLLRKCINNNSSNMGGILKKQIFLSGCHACAGLIFLIVIAHTHPVKTIQSTAQNEYPEVFPAVK